MTREFIITKEFDHTWKELGLTDEKANLTKAERNQMKNIVTAIKNAEKETQDGRK